MNIKLIQSLEEVIQNLKNIRNEVWGNNKNILPIDKEIKSLEVIMQSCDGYWNGIHPIGVT